MWILQVQILYVYIYMLCISLHRMSCKTVAQLEMMEGDDSNWLVSPDHPYSLLGFDALKAFASAAEILGGSSRAKNQPGHDSNSICNTIQHQHDILYREHVDTIQNKQLIIPWKAAKALWRLSTIMTLTPTDPAFLLFTCNFVAGLGCGLSTAESAVVHRNLKD